MNFFDQMMHSGQPTCTTHPSSLRVWVATLDHSHARAFRRGAEHPCEIAQFSRHSLGLPDGLSGEEKIFMRFFGLWLDEAHREHLYDRLILIAPAGLISSLRLALPPGVADCVIAEIGRDFSTLNKAERNRQLEEIMWF